MKEVLPAPLGPAMISICLELFMLILSLYARGSPRAKFLVKAARLYGWQVRMSRLAWSNRHALSLRS